MLPLDPRPLSLSLLLSCKPHHCASRSEASFEARRYQEARERLEKEESRAEESERVRDELEKEVTQLRPRMKAMEAELAKLRLLQGRDETQAAKLEERASEVEELQSWRANAEKKIAVLEEGDLGKEMEFHRAVVGEMEREMSRLKSVRTAP